MDKKDNRIIILASKSPRRIEILRKHGIDAVVMPMETDETLPPDIGMTEAVEMLARRKAEACYDYVKTCAESNPEYMNAYIIGADTIVWKGEIMGKPADAEDAFRMLDMIRGTVHYVATGVAVIDTAYGECIVRSDVTKVHCVNYSDDDIRAYLAMDEPYDKAGSYAIQGYFGRYIDHIEGDYENVMGLPYHILEPMLKEK